MQLNKHIHCKYKYIAKSKLIHSTHSSIHHAHINSLNKNAGIKHKNAYLERIWSTISYVPAMFHPTISQCAHQSLNITATPELGMIPQGTVEQQQAHT